MNKPERDNTKMTATVTMSPFELGQLGDGYVAYIKELAPDEAKEMFPGLEGAPEGINLFVLQGADGMPIALTDSRSEAMAHASEDELTLAAVH